MRDQVAHRLCVPAVPAWLRPTAGDPHFLADRGVFRRKMYILGLYFSQELNAWSYTECTNFNNEFLGIESVAQ